MIDLRPNVILEDTSSHVTIRHSPQHLILSHDRCLVIVHARHHIRQTSHHLLLLLVTLSGLLLR